MSAYKIKLYLNRKINRLKHFSDTDKKNLKWHNILLIIHLKISHKNSFFFVCRNVERLKKG